jgi:hypothetical protein
MNLCWIILKNGYNSINEFFKMIFLFKFEFINLILKKICFLHLSEIRSCWWIKYCEISDWEELDIVIDMFEWIYWEKQNAFIVWEIKICWEELILKLIDKCKILMKFQVGKLKVFFEKRSWLRFKHESYVFLSREI